MAHATPEKTTVYNKSYYAQNAERLREKRRRYYYANKAQSRAYDQTRNARPEVMAQKKENLRRYESTLEGYLSSRLWQAKNRAKRQRLPLEIVLDDLLRLWRGQEGRCVVTGLPLALGNGLKDEKASIDRIDPSSGYTRENVRLVCWWVNQARNDGTDGDLLKWAGLVARGLEEKAHSSFQTNPRT